MKKNSIKYMLGTALFGVWGLFGFRVYEKMNKQDSYSPHQATADYSIPETSSRDFKLALTYQDPFLGKSLRAVRSGNTAQPVKASSSNKRRVVKKIKKEKRVIFPNIHYKGNIRTDDGREVALMSVNGKFVQLGKSKSFNDLKLLNVAQDSIRVKYLGEEKTIGRVRSR